LVVVVVVGMEFVPACGLFFSYNNINNINIKRLCLLAF